MNPVGAKVLMGLGISGVLTAVSLTTYKFVSSKSADKNLEKKLSKTRKVLSTNAEDKVTDNDQWKAKVTAYKSKNGDKPDLEGYAATDSENEETKISKMKQACKKILHEDLRNSTEAKEKAAIEWCTVEKTK